MADTASGTTIIVKIPGRAPDELTGLARAVVLAIPIVDAANNSTLMQIGMSAEQLAETGAYLIKVAHSMKTGRPPAPFGQRPGPKRSNSGLILPN